MPVSNTTVYDVIKSDSNNALAFFASVLALAGVILNNLLIYVIFRTKTLHTCTNSFIVSLSVAELLVAIFVVPFAAVSKISTAWVFSTSLCTVSGFVYNVGRNGAAYSLMFVCVDRCVAVSKPLKYSNIITPRTTIVFTLLAWGQSILLALIPFFGKGVYTFITKFSLCMLLGDTNSAHMLFKEIFGCLLPSFVIILTVLKIVKESRSHHRVFAAMPMPLTTQPTRRNYGRNTLRAMRALFVIVLSYALFCMPLSIVKILDQMCCPHLPEVLVTSFVWLSFLCCAINPVVIATMNKTFKRSFVSIVCGCVKSHGSAEKEGFTITTGLQTMLDTTLVISIIQNSEKALRQQRLAKARTRQSHVFITLIHHKHIMRRTQSTPEYRMPGTSLGN